MTTLANAIVSTRKQQKLAELMLREKDLVRMDAEMNFLEDTNFVVPPEPEDFDNIDVAFNVGINWTFGI